MLEQRISTVVVEKNKQALSLLLNILKKHEAFEIEGAATTGANGVSLIANHAPQLAIINTELQDIDGLELARVLRNRNISTEIVFTSDSADLVFESLPLEPLDFLVNPFAETEIPEMLARLKKRLKKNELIRKMEIYAKSQSIVPKRKFVQKGGILILTLREILFFRADLSSTILTLTGGEEVKIKTNITQTLETVNNEDFLRINRSYCINKNYLRQIDKRNFSVTLYDQGKTWEVPASKNTIGWLEKLSAALIC